MPRLLSVANQKCRIASIPVHQFCHPVSHSDGLLSENMSANRKHWKTTSCEADGLYLVLKNTSAWKDKGEGRHWISYWPRCRPTERGWGRGVGMRREQGILPQPPNFFWKKDPMRMVLHVTIAKITSSWHNDCCGVILYVHTVTIRHVMLVC